MRWRKVEGSGHVEDRRGRRGAAVGGAVGGLGILGILAALFFGVAAAGSISTTCSIKSGEVPRRLLRARTSTPAQILRPSWSSS